MADEELERQVEELYSRAQGTFMGRLMPEKLMRERIEQYVLGRAYDDDPDSLSSEQKKRLAHLTHILGLERIVVMGIMPVTLGAYFGIESIRNPISNIDYLFGGLILGSSSLASLLGASLGLGSLNKSRRIREEANDEKRIS